MGRGGGGREVVVPVRPNTLVTLTSLTGTLPESMVVASQHLYRRYRRMDVVARGRFTRLLVRERCCCVCFLGVAICESLWDAEGGPRR